MTKQTYTIRSSRAFAALLFASACAISACGSDDGSDPYVPLGNGGLTQDGSAVVTADSGTTPIGTTPDAGAVVTPFDAGTTPIVTGDAGPVVVIPTGDAGPVATGDGGATPDGGGTARPDQGKGDGKDVICIGDSWMAYNSTNLGIEFSLEKASAQKYRKYGVSGTKLLKPVGSSPPITGQYDAAKKDGPIKTVVMTGGGNDILQEQLLPCLDANFDNDMVCPNQIDGVAAGLTKLWAQMATDGVQDVLIVGYSNKTTPLGLGSTAKSITYSNMKINPICAMVPAPLRCTTLDTDMAVPDISFMSDGIHPDSPSYDKIGVAVWKLMQDKGMRR